jgi:hypothetical protein
MAAAGGARVEDIAYLFGLATFGAAGTKGRSKSSGGGSSG